MEADEKLRQLGLVQQTRWSQRPQAEIYRQDRTLLLLLQIGAYVQRDVTVIYLLKPPHPPLSLSLLTHSCDLCVTLFTGSVCDLLVCLGHSCVYWLCGSVTVQFGHTNPSSLSSLTAAGCF